MFQIANNVKQVFNFDNNKTEEPAKTSITNFPVMRMSFNNSREQGLAKFYCYIYLFMKIYLMSICNTHLSMKKTIESVGALVDVLESS